MSIQRICISTYFIYLYFMFIFCYSILYYYYFCFYIFFSFIFFSTFFSIQCIYYFCFYIIFYAMHFTNFLPFVCSCTFNVYTCDTALFKLHNVYYQLNFSYLGYHLRIYIHHNVCLFFCIYYMILLYNVKRIILNISSYCPNKMY